MRKDSAVSPVIGTILMVAITVILAAIIAAFVFGMTGNVNKTKVVSLVAEKSGNSQFSVTNFGGQDVKQLNAITVKITDGSGANVGFTETGDLTSKTTVVGSQSKLSMTTNPTTARLLITGTFKDGNNAILIDRTY